MITAVTANGVAAHDSDLRDMSHKSGAYQEACHEKNTGHGSGAGYENNAGHGSGAGYENNAGNADKERLLPALPDDGTLQYLKAEAVPASAWKAAGHHFGWERSARPANAHDAWLLTLPEDSAPENLENTLVAPVNAVVLASVHQPALLSDGWEGAAATGFALFFSITTVRAMAIRLAPLVCSILVRRAILPPNMQSNVELCFQEALANALIHGNLDVPSALKKGREGFLKFSATIQDRLQDPEYGQRRVEIGVSQTPDGFTLHVGDQGEGYEASALHGAAPREASGRGFLFMQALAQQVRISDGGRCVCLHFSHSPESRDPAANDPAGRAA